MVPVPSKKITELGDTAPQSWMDFGNLRKIQDPWAAESSRGRKLTKKRPPNFLDSVKKIAGLMLLDQCEYG